MKVAITDTDSETETALPSNASVRIIISDTTARTIKQISSVTVSGSAEQFYDLSPLLSWTKKEDGSAYVSDYSVVILNDSGVVLSLTTFKTTFSANTEISPEMSIAPVSDRSTLRFAMSSIQKVLTSADDSTLDMTWETTDLTAGAKAKLTVTTSSEIVSLKVGDLEFTDYVENEDGTRTWTCEVLIREGSDQSFDLVLTDSFGRTSETFSTTIPGDFEQEENNDSGDETNNEGNNDSGDETNNEGNNDNQNESFFRRVINWIKELFNKIISFFKLG